MTDKSAELAEINSKVTKLKKSPLYSYRHENNYFPVIGEGSCDAKIMFVGEAPGRNEAKTGRPFCGTAGKVLDELLSSVKIKRADVYITNIVKDRPQNNRDPLPEEIKIYAPFLDKQIEIIQPEIIATLGRYSMDYVMRKFGLSDQIEPIGKAHGKLYKAQASYGPIQIAVLYHPCAAVYNPNKKGILKEDIKIIKNSKACPNCITGRVKTETKKLKVRFSEF